MSTRRHLLLTFTTFTTYIARIGLKIKRLLLHNLQGEHIMLLTVILRVMKELITVIQR